jgi:hypothetical protein
MKNRTTPQSSPGADGAVVAGLRLDDLVADRITD